MFGAAIELLRQIFRADAFRDRDGAADRQRLVRKRQPRRRNKAVHRSFFGTGLIALSRAPRRSAGSSLRSAGTWRWNSRAYAAHSRAWWKSCPRSASRMRTTTLLSRPAKSRTRAWNSWACGPRTLEDRLTANHALGTALHRRLTLSTSRRRLARLHRRHINRTGARLRSDHTPLGHRGLLRA